MIGFNGVVQPEVFVTVTILLLSPVTHGMGNIVAIHWLSGQGNCHDPFIHTLIIIIIIIIHGTCRPSDQANRLEL